ncbi:unnamed protein product [Miscanthus lutarioriparius]|uniref:Uncharacterized protein n=1 Tax=Miscanthus lutarioriparius TaxID=422564 RepID=A0A811QA43_9POAL|nr:unnamed protein product [Miscanthus lutarioriparius]
MLSGGGSTYRSTVVSSVHDSFVLQKINVDGVKRNFYPGDKLPLWHDELEPHNSLLDILAAGNPDPMVQ